MSEATPTTTAGAASADPERARARTAADIKRAVDFSKLVSILASSPAHAQMRLSDLHWAVIPPLMTGQYAIANVPPQPGSSSPAAMVVWASVSAAIDARLTADLAKPIRLAPNEWKSGDIPWVVEAIGDIRLLQPLFFQIQGAVFKTADPKLRLASAGGQPFVGRLSQLLASAENSA